MTNSNLLFDFKIIFITIETFLFLILALKVLGIIILEKSLPPIEKNTKLFAPVRDLMMISWLIFCFFLFFYCPAFRNFFFNSADRSTMVIMIKAFSGLAFIFFLPFAVLEFLEKKLIAIGKIKLNSNSQNKINK